METLLYQQKKKALNWELRARKEVNCMVADFSVKYIKNSIISQVKKKPPTGKEVEGKKQIKQGVTFYGQG